MSAGSAPPLGTVFGTLLNFPGELAALGAKAHQPPHGAPPQAPVLYIKTANTFSPNGARIALPPPADEVEVGATLGMVMDGSGGVAGWRVLGDLSLPQANLFRPPVRSNCLDGFLGIGDLRPAGVLDDVAGVVVELRINGELRQAISFGALLRGPSRLRADVAEFMTLAAGDVLMLGCDVLADGRRPRARAGDRIEISAAGLGTLANTLVEGAA